MKAGMPSRRPSRSGTEGDVIFRGALGLHPRRDLHFFRNADLFPGVADDFIGEQNDRIAVDLSQIKRLNRKLKGLLHAGRGEGDHFIVAVGPVFGLHDVLLGGGSRLPGRRPSPHHVDDHDGGFGLGRPADPFLHQGESRARGCGAGFRPSPRGPRAVQIEAISSSICKNTPRWRGSSRDMSSVISEAGVMGYPAKNRQPAAIAASTQASFPWITFVCTERSPSQAQAGKNCPTIARNPPKFNFPGNSFGVLP